MSQKVILSKAEAILILAHADSQRCQGGNFLLRVLSNYATIGRDASSSIIKRDNPRISKGASKLRSELTRREFEKATINEHPEPLIQVWLWIVENKTKLQPLDIVRRIYSYPMVTVTKVEDQLMNEAGFRQTGLPEERFKAGKIKLCGDYSLKVEPKFDFESDTRPAA